MNRTSSARPSIAVMIPVMDSIRNFVYSGILEGLVEAGFDVHLLLYQAAQGEQFSKAATCSLLLPPPVRRSIRGLPMLKQVIASAYSRRNNIDSYALYRRWREKRISLKHRLRSQLIELLGAASQPRPIFEGLVRLFNRLYIAEHDLDTIQAQFQALQPDFLLSTYNVIEPYERAYVLSARKLGIPVVNEIMSFDNLTSKSNHLVYDHYLVWNQGMRDQLLRFYPQVRPDQVQVTGTPQFDYHLRPECHWSREFTLRRLGLPPEAHYILYAAGHANLTPQEPELVAQLARRIQANPLLRSLWLVVRLHPRDDWPRWEPVAQASERLVVSKSWGENDAQTGINLPTPDDQSRLTNSLRHASACINIASTITFDAAILDRPVIGIRFDKEPDAPRDILYEEYDADHYRPLVEAGGLRLAHTWAELQDLMVDAVTDPQRDCRQRAAMVANECGPLDGKAAQRVTAALVEFHSHLNR